MAARERGTPVLRWGRGDAGQHPAAKNPRGKTGLVRPSGLPPPLGGRLFFGFVYYCLYYVPAFSSYTHTLFLCHFYTSLRSRFRAPRERVLFTSYTHPLGLGKGLPFTLYPPPRPHSCTPYPLGLGEWPVVHLYHTPAPHPRKRSRTRRLSTPTHLQPTRAAGAAGPPIEMTTVALLGPFFNQSSFRDDDLRGFRVGVCAAACCSICCAINFCRRST